MKTLIYKDWLQTRKLYLSLLLFSALTAVLFLLVRISMNCGNLADNEEVRLSLERNIYIFRYIPPFVLMLALLENSYIIKESECGFLRFMQTTSVREETIVAEKMLYKLIILSAAFVISVIYNAFLCIADGKPLTLHIIANIASIFFLISGLSFYDIVMSFAFRKNQTVLMIKTSAAVVLYLVWGILTFKRLDELSENPDFDILDFFRSEYSLILNNAFLFMLLFAALSAAAGYFLSVRILRRREMP